MKAKRTLRKLPPLTRAIAKLQRDTHSIDRRFDAIIKLADEIEQEGRTLRRENAELRGKLVAVRKLNVRHCDHPEPPLWPVTKPGEVEGPNEEAI